MKASLPLSCSAAAVLGLVLLLIPNDLLGRQQSTWSGFRGDEARTGRAAGPGPDRPAPSWTFRLEGVGYASPAIDADGNLYVGSSDSLYSLTMDGRRRWAAPSNGYVISSPAVHGQTVYFGSLDGGVYAVHSGTGAPRWTFRTSDEVWSSPVIALDGTIYIGSFDGCLYALTPAGSERWRHCVDGPIAASPAIGSNGTIYFGSRDGNFYALAPNGSRRWAFSIGAEVVATSPIGDNGAIYVASRDGGLFALRPNGTPLWIEPYRTGEEIIASPALGRDGTIYVGAADGSLHAVRPDGTTRWSSPFRTGAEIYSSPAVDTRGTVYFGGGDGFIYAVEPDGSLRWEFETPDRIWASPAIGPDGSLYVSTTGDDDLSGRLFTVASIEFDVDEPEILPGDDGGILVRIRVPEALLPVTAHLQFRRGGERTFPGAVVMDSVEPGVLDGRIAAEFVTIRGLEYHIEVTGADYHRTFPVHRPEERPAVYRVTTGRTELPLALSRRIYRMISVPAELNSASVDDVLSDQYGTYSPIRWRLFRWGGDAYVEHPQITAGFAPGNAFFLSTSTGAGFAIDGGLSIDTSEPYRVQLLPGWNQIANPFAFPVAWQDVQRDPGAVSAIAYWDGREMRSDAAHTAVLQPWEGYFVHNDAARPVTISFPPREAAQSPPFDAPQVAHHALRLSAFAEGDLRDTQNWIGFSGTQYAAVRREAPQIGDHVRLSILDGGTRYAQLLRPLSGSGSTWSVQVSASRELKAGDRMPVTLVIHPEGSLPDGFVVRVWDLERGFHFEPAEGRFEIELTAQQPARHFEVVVGTPSFASEYLAEVDDRGLRLNLSQNYPNPFPGGTSISYELDRADVVSLTVYDVAGRVVRELVNEWQPEGPHVVEWDARDQSGRVMANGAYLYRLRTPHGAVSRVLILLR